MGDRTYGYLLGLAIFGIPVLAFKVTRFMLRIAWWLGLWVILSLGAAVIAITRAGKSGPDETAGIGELTKDKKNWQDTASGQLFPISETEYENCEIQATLAGQYWRDTALSRLLRKGSIWRYRFDAVTDGSDDIAATHEFPQEARVNLNLDTVDPAHASTDQYNQADNRELALRALAHMDWLLTSRGWTPIGQTPNLSNQHWYATRYRRPVISWTNPLDGEAPTPEIGGPSPLDAVEEP